MATKSIQQQVKRAKRARNAKSSSDNFETNSPSRKGSSTNYTKLLKGWASMPAMKIVAGGIAGYALMKGAMALYNNRESISDFFKENYENVEHKIKDLQSEYADHEARH